MISHDAWTTWWPRGLVIGLLLLVLGLPFLFRPAQKPGQLVLEDSPRLVIATPHNEQIRYEFARAFNQWRVANGQTPVIIEWRTGGGASDLRKQILDQFARSAIQGREDDGIGWDIVFGGGDFEHNILANGVTVELNGAKVQVPIAIPIELPPGMLEEVFPVPTIGGERLYHPEMKWVGVVLSAFGIVYNNDLLQMSKQQPPTTWADLADTRYLQSIALADPAHSGSIAVAYNTILRRHGWDEGWSILRRVFANARYFSNAAGQVPIDVSAGEATAGMCIDFYGRYQAKAVGQGRVGYVDPPFMTTITADPILILRGTKQRELAQQFVTWLLTPEAQMLWQARQGTPWGPEKFELRRMPIRRDMYTPENRAQWTDEINPYLITRPFPKDMPDFYRSVALLAHAMAIDVHDELVAAWKAIVENPTHPQRQKMLELFDAMPEELIPRWPSQTMKQGARRALEDPGSPTHEETVAVLNNLAAELRQRWRNPDQMLRDRLAWTLFFRENYRQVVALSRQ